MVLVVIIGIFLGGLVLKRRSDYFTSRAIYYAESEKSCADSAANLERLSNELATKPDDFLDALGLGTSTNVADRSGVHWMLSGCATTQNQVAG